MHAGFWDGIYTDKTITGAFFLHGSSPITLIHHHPVHQLGFIRIRHQCHPLISCDKDS